MTLDPKSFYNQTMPEKYGPEYEEGRWNKTPLVAAQYRMLEQALESHVLPSVRDARRIIEVGPGPGTWTKKILATNKTADYTLVDISSEMLSQAKAALPQGRALTFVESDFVAYTSEQEFDYFFSSRAIEYMPDKEQAVAQIAHLLRPGGSGAVITKTPKPGLDKLRGRTLSALHQGQISMKDLVALFTKAGLVIDGVYVATATVPGLRSVLLNKLAFALLRHIPLAPPLTLFTESYLVRFDKPL